MFFTRAQFFFFQRCPFSRFFIFSTSYSLFLISFSSCMSLILSFWYLHLLILLSSLLVLQFWTSIFFSSPLYLIYYYLKKKWDDLAATGLSVLAGADFVKSVMDQKPMAGPLLWMGSGHSSVIILSLLGMLRLAKFLAVETLMMICFKVPIPLSPPNNMISSNCFLLF